MDLAWDGRGGTGSGSAGEKTLFEGGEGRRTINGAGKNRIVPQPGFPKERDEMPPRTHPPRRQPTSYRSIRNEANEGQPLQLFPSHPQAVRIEETSALTSRAPTRDDDMKGAKRNSHKTQPSTALA